MSRVKASLAASSRPRFGEKDAVRLGAAFYGLDATASELPSERDQNFRLTTTAGEAFVLKISRADERPEELDMQNRALEWVATRRADLGVPRLRTTRSGAPMQEVGAASGQRHLVRLLTHLPGTPLALVRPHTPALLRRLGRFLGELGGALAGFSHPAARGRDLDWDPLRARLVIDALKEGVPDPGLRARIERALDEHAEFAVPRLPALRRSAIHNDANDHNVLVGPPAAPEREIAGLLDFGDMVESWTVAEVAVAAAYAMLGQPDPLGAAAHVVAGHHETFRLDEAELAVVYPLACLRLCTSLCLAARRRTTEPDNDYLTISEAPVRRALEALGDVHPRYAEATFRDACGLSACPTSPAVLAWLGEHRQELAPVVEADPARALVLDLGVSSPDLESPEAAADRPKLEALIFGKLAAAGAALGIGRYAEARLLYASDAYAGVPGEHPERRTVHLGVDLFVPAGSPVHAPLAGHVHSLANNAARLDYGPTIVLQHQPPGAPAFYTLYGHLSLDSLDGVAPGQPVARGSTIGRVGAPPANGDWPPHLHLQLVADLLGRRGDFPGVAAPGQRGIWSSLSPDPGPLLGLPEGAVAARAPAPDTLRAERRARLAPSLSLAYRRPLQIVRGFGARLYDQEGRAFLDGVNNVAHVGHGHPRVVRAGARQMAVLNTNTRYLHEHILEYARRLGALLPEPLRVCFFVCSGSEANELALRLARTATGGRDVIVVEGAYHGNTSALVEASPYKFDGPGGQGAPPHVHKVPMPDDYRGLYRRAMPERGEAFAAHVGAAAEDARRHGARPAAFLCESLLSCGGQVELPAGFLAGAYRHARAAGALCIADEVQVGFGRVGSHFWGFETQGVVPDIVTLGKPIGNGHPLGAVVTTPEIAAAFANGMEYFNTFGGNPVSCAIGLAVLDVIRDEGLQQRALRVGARLKAGLAGLAERHAIVGDARGLGLFLGIELVRDRASLEPAAEEAAYVVERMKDRGVLVSTDGPLHNVIKLKPPLVFGEGDADQALAAFDAVLAEDYVRARVRG
jgi:4-aminobutyrate aminotransferase-like enzyme/Ser/Thr protein kinase RdoA (MazF antagonist)